MTEESASTESNTPAATAESAESEAASDVGKTLTWWHPLFVQFLKYELEDAYEVRDEVSVGELPLKADVVLIQCDDGELPDTAADDIPSLIARLNLWTMIEFKGPTDTLERGDLDRLFGVAHLYCSQQKEPIGSDKLNLIILAPTLTGPFIDDVATRGATLHEESAGVHRLDGAFFKTCVLESDVLTGPDEPIVAMVSRLFLKDRDRIIEELQGRADHVLKYAIQQIQQFRLQGDEFLLRHKGTEEMQPTLEELTAAVMEATPLEERLRGLPNEDLLKRIPHEERMKGLSAEDVLKYFDAHELRRIRQLLNQDEIDEELSDDQSATNANGHDS